MKITRIIETKLGNTESELIELKKLLNFKINRNKIIFTGRVLNISGGTFAKQWLKWRSIDELKEVNLIFLWVSRFYYKRCPSSSRVLNNDITIYHLI